MGTTTLRPGSVYLDPSSAEVDSLVIPQLSDVVGATNQWGDDSDATYVNCHAWHDTSAAASRSDMPSANFPAPAAFDWYRFRVRASCAPENVTPIGLGVRLLLSAATDTISDYGADPFLPLNGVPTPTWIDVSNGPVTDGPPSEATGWWPASHIVFYSPTTALRLTTYWDADSSNLGEAPPGLFFTIYEVEWVVATDGQPQPYRAPLRLYPRSDARRWPRPADINATPRRIGYK